MHETEVVMAIGAYRELVSIRIHAVKERRRSLQLLNMRASRSGELRVKEALHIHLTPEDQRFKAWNYLHGCCRVSTLKALHASVKGSPFCFKGFFSS